MFEFLYLLKDVLAFAGYLTQGRALPKPLTPDEETKYLQSYLSGDEESRKVLIERNMRLVVHIAKKYDNSRLENDDLISIGTIGLIKGINTYNTKKGTQLATYCARCIENEILMALRTTKKLVGEMSLNDPIGTDKEGNEISLLDVLDTGNESVIDQVDTTIQVEKLYGILAKELSPREKFVLELRFGLYGGEALTQREIATKLNISRSYVSRIEKKAVEKLSKSFSIDNFEQE